MVPVPTRSLKWHVGSVANLITLKGIVVVETRRITQALVVLERGLRTIPKTKVHAIAWLIDSVPQVMFVKIVGPCKGKRLLGPNGGSGGKFKGGFGGNVRSCGGNGGRGGSIAKRGGGSLAKRSIESKDSLGVGGFVVLRGRSSSEDCLDGWVGAGGGEVKGGGVDFGLTRTFL
ncbi:hypothetical protein Tco_1260188, partial [Tanacetum coccineum]